MRWESENKYLMHHGIKGQKWGVRRFQNEDGTLTEEGRERYLKDLSKTERKMYDDLPDDPKRRIDKQIAEGKNFETAYREEVHGEINRLGAKRVLSGARDFIVGMGARHLSAIAEIKGHHLLASFLGGFGLAERVGGIYKIGSGVLRTASANENARNMSLKELRELSRKEERPR